MLFNVSNVVSLVFYKRESFEFLKGYTPIIFQSVMAEQLRMGSLRVTTAVKEDAFYFYTYFRRQYHTRNTEIIFLQT